MAAYPPIPQPDYLTRFFWDGANDHRLLILRCQDCRHYVHYPRPLCNECLSTNLEPEQVSGEATLHSYTIPSSHVDAYFAERAPYVYAVVELAEAPALRMATNVVDCPEEELRTGMPLVVDFREILPGVTLPYFRRA